MDALEYMNARKSPNWKFNKVVPDDSFLSVNKIHPLKQLEVKLIVDEARKDSHVKSIKIFGSATRYDCNIDSDLDICVDWNEDCYDDEGVLKPFTVNLRKAIANITKGNSDVLNEEYLEGTEVEAAARNGVVVYEHNV